MPVEAPLDGEAQHGVENADDFGALEHRSDLALACDQPGRLLGGSDGRGRVDLDAVEMHTRITLRHVDRRLRLDRHAGCGRRDQELAHRVVAPCDHQEQVALVAGLDAVLHPVEAKACRGRCRRQRGVQR